MRPPPQGLHATTPRHIAASNEGLIVGRPVRNAALRLIRGMNLRLHPCSVAPAEGHEKCAPPPHGLHATTPRFASTAFESRHRSRFRSRQTFFDSGQLFMPPFQCLPINISCVVAFAIPVQDRTIEILSYRKCLLCLRRLASTEVSRSGRHDNMYLLFGMRVELILLHNIISLFVDEIPENLIGRSIGFPPTVRSINKRAERRSFSILLGEHVPDRPRQRHRSCPMNPPTSKVLFTLQQLQSDLTVGQNFSCFIGHFGFDPRLPLNLDTLKNSIFRQSSARTYPHAARNARESSQ